jgi:hypothetical protein
VEAYGIALSDFGRSADQEVLILKRADPRNHASALDADDDAEPMPILIRAAGVKQAKWMNYRDTAESIALRQQLKSLNEFIAAADIQHPSGDTFDLTDRAMRRHFTQPPEEETPRWDLGGRLFYRRLSHLTKDYRQHLTINGSQIQGLDFKSMFGRLAYALTNTHPAADDLYTWQGLEGHRDGVKLAFNTLLFAGGQGKQFGKDTRDALPKALTPDVFRNVFARHHPALVPLLTFDAGGGLPIGYALMHTESRIMATTLERLMQREIVAIGLHDGLIIGKEHAAVARSIMADSAQEIVGVSIPVEDKES